MTDRIDIRKIVRFAIECAGLAAFCAGRDEDALLSAGECADRGEFAEARRLCRVASASAAAYAASDAAAAAAADAADAADAARFTAREQCARRAKELFIPEFFLARTLRALVAQHIETRPELHDQGSWGDGEANPACGTPCCVAGWACHLGGGSRGLAVSTMASALLFVEGKPEVPFDSSATREEILTALRA